MVPYYRKGNSLTMSIGVGSEVNNEQNLVNVVLERPLIFVFVRKDERLRDRNKLLRGNDLLNVQIHSQLFPISLFLCTFLCNHGLSMFRRKIQMRTYFLYCAVFIISYCFHPIWVTWFLVVLSMMLRKYYVIICLFLILFCPSCLANRKHRTENQATKVTKNQKGSYQNM